MMPNQENIQKWVDALESGKFVQTQGALRRNSFDNDDKEVQFCCLGVACEVARANGIRLDLAKESSDYTWIDNDWEDPSTDDGKLPELVCDWLGVEDPNPLLNGETCIALNDDQELSFPEIAQRIKETFLKA